MKKLRNPARRTICVLLAVVMLLSASPFAALAEAEPEGVPTTFEGGAKLVSSVQKTAAPNLTVGAFRLQMGGAGSVELVAVSDAAWNANFESGVSYYYTLLADGSEFSNSPYGTPLPSSLGEVDYCYIYYAEDPSTAGRGLANAVPVGMSQSAWNTLLANNTKDGVLAEDGVLSGITSWTSAANTDLPLAVSYAVAAGSVTIEHEAHWYSVLLRFTPKEGEPQYSTENGIVYVHGGDGGDGGGGGAGGGGGGGVVVSGFVAPAQSLYADTGKWVNGKGFTPIGDVELDDLSSDPGVSFFYHCKDAEGNTYGLRPDEHYFGDGSNELQYVFVYSDTDPKDDPLTAYAPVGMTKEAWLETVAAFEAAHPGTKDYSDLLAALPWQAAGDGALPAFSNEQCCGTEAPSAAHTYSDRWYSVFMRWHRGENALYSTDSLNVYVHRKEPDVITTPISNGAARPCLTEVNVLSARAHVISRTATETEIDFRYTFTDADGVVWTNIPGDGCRPRPPQHPFRLDDRSDPPALRRRDRLRLRGGRRRLFLALVFLHGAHYREGDGRDQGLYEQRRGLLRPPPHRKLQRAQCPVTMEALGLTFWNTNYENHYWDTMHYMRRFTTEDAYTDYVMRYSVKDLLNQRYGRVDTSFPDLPKNARIEFLWTYIPWDDATGGSTEEVTAYEPNFDQIPTALSKEEWYALIDGKTTEEKLAVLDSLSGWTTDNRLPTFFVGKYYYYAYTRIVIEDQPTQYYWEGCTVGINLAEPEVYPFLRDWSFTIGENVPASLTFVCDRNVTGYGSHLQFQWYEADSRDPVGEPIDGATSKTFVLALDPDTSFTKYYYCAYTYRVSHNTVVNGRTNIARVTVSSAPTGTVTAFAGRSYYGPEAGVSVFKPSSQTHSGGGSLQTLGSVGTLSARWDCVGRPFYMTLQWYVSDDADALGEPIGELHTVWDPVEEDAVGCEPAKKADISRPCPSDELGDRYYRVVCTNYAKNGDFFSVTSEAVKITTIPASERDRLFEVYDDGRLVRCFGFEDELIVPAAVGGVAVTSIASLHCPARRIELPEGVESIPGCPASRRRSTNGRAASSGSRRSRPTTCASFSRPTPTRTTSSTTSSTRTATTSSTSGKSSSRARRSRRRLTPSSASCRMRASSRRSTSTAARTITLRTSRPAQTSSSAGEWTIFTPSSPSKCGSVDPEAVDGWLPVPPPQMNVNIGLVSMAAPEVAEVRFSGAEMRVAFTQYMDIAMLEADPALLTITKNGEPVAYAWEFMDREASPKDETVFYGRTLCLTPAAGYDFDGAVALTVSGSWRSYAGAAIGIPYESGTLAPASIPATIEHSYPNRLVTDVGDEIAIAVRLLDTSGAPITGKTVCVTQSYPLYELADAAVTDANGRAVFDAVTLRCGSGVLTFT